MLRSPEERAARETLRKAAKARQREKMDKGPVKIGGEVVEIPPRPKLSQSVRARVLAKSHGHCAYAGCTETRGLEIDHILPRELGGSDSEANLSALCGPHHKAKTKRDVAMIAKARRIRRKLAEPRKPSKLKSRGFDAGYRPIPSGTPVRRDRSERP